MDAPSTTASSPSTAATGGPLGTPGGAPAIPKKAQPPLSVSSEIAALWGETDALPQRKNALWEYREGNKTLFPARFNPTDPRRGQVVRELRNGRDDRRVQVPYIYRDGLQTVAMAVPEDLSFGWEKRRLVAPPTPPGVPAPASPTGMMQPDPALQFAETLTVTMDSLMKEALINAKMRAWVQDAEFYPLGVLKFQFRRDYQSSFNAWNIPSRDLSDNVARLQALMTRFAQGEFRDSDYQYQEMLDLAKGIAGQAEVQQYFGVELENIPMDCFGVSEETGDIIDIYDAPWMFHDVLMNGEELLTKYPYRTEMDENGREVGYGLHPDDLGTLTPWEPMGGALDPWNRNRASRNKQNTTPTVNSAASLVPGGAVSNPAQNDPRKRRFLIRELWHKRRGMVYVMGRGLQNYLSVFVPQKRPRRWYPFAILAPNRVPGEVYAVSTLELKRDIQARIHRKRSDEEKSRWLSLPRGIYDTALVTENEMLKMGEIPPGQLKGVNTGGKGTGAKDLISWFSYRHEPEAFATAQDEQDMVHMGALPSQATGVTGIATYATEVQVAAQGSALSTQSKQGLIRREMEGMLTAIAEILIQEMDPDEVKMIGGPFAFFPEIYGENESKAIIDEARQRAQQQVLPIVLQAAVTDMQNGQPISPEFIKRAVQSQVDPVVAAEMMQRFGRMTPLTRLELFHALEVKVRSSLSSQLDQQQRIQNVATMAGAIMQMAQAAQAAAIPFNPRPLLKIASKFLNEEDALEEIFPAIAPSVPPAGPGAPAVGGAPQQQESAPKEPGGIAGQATGTPAEAEAGGQGPAQKSVHKGPTAAPE